MKLFIKLFQFLDRKNMPKKEIYEKANSSFEFDYCVQRPPEVSKDIEEVGFSQALKNIPKEDVEMTEVDYYA